MAQNPQDKEGSPKQKRAKARRLGAVGHLGTVSVHWEKSENLLRFRVRGGRARYVSLEKLWSLLGATDRIEEASASLAFFCRQFEVAKDAATEAGKGAAAVFVMLRDSLTPDLFREFEISKPNGGGDAADGSEVKEERGAPGGREQSERPRSVLDPEATTPANLPKGRKVEP
jgi:hypothetical protein